MATPKGVTIAYAHPNLGLGLDWGPALYMAVAQDAE